jgi:hypothetical protein
MPNIPLQVSDYIYQNWNVPGIDKDDDVYWNSWYTGKDDITIHCSELITLPTPVTLPWYRFDYRSYIDINIFVTDNKGTNAPRRDLIRQYLEELINGDPSGLEPIGYDPVKIDSIMPRDEFDEDYRNNIFRLIVRLEMLACKQF